MVKVGPRGEEEEERRKLRGEQCDVIPVPVSPRGTNNAVVSPRRMGLNKSLLAGERKTGDLRFLLESGEKVFTAKYRVGLLEAEWEW